MTASPMSFSIVPPWRSTTSRMRSNQRSIAQRSVSGSTRSPSAVDPTTSAKTIVTILRRVSTAQLYGSGSRMTAGPGAGVDKREPLVHHGVCASGAAGSHRGDGSCSGSGASKPPRRFRFSGRPTRCVRARGRAGSAARTTASQWSPQRPTVLRLYVSGASPGANVGAAVTSPSTGGGYGSTFTLVGTGSMVASAAPAVRGNPATTLQVALRPHPAGTYRFDVVVLEYATNWGSAVSKRDRLDHAPVHRAASNTGPPGADTTTPAGDWMSPPPRSRTSGTSPTSPSACCPFPRRASSSCANRSRPTTATSRASTPPRTTRCGPGTWPIEGRPATC